MGPAATVNFQSLLVKEINEAGVVEDSFFPRIITLSFPLKEWDHLGARDKTRVAEQVCSGLRWLEAQGSQIIAVPCNTVHEFVDSPVALNILDESLACCAHAKVVGVLCSRHTRDARLYERNEDQRYIYVGDQSAIDDVISEVLAGNRLLLDDYVWELRDRGANAIILGCTELSVCPMPYHQGATIVDSSQVLAAAVVRELRKRSRSQ